MNSVQIAIKHFNLEVKEIHEVTESFSSTVNILTLISGKKVVLKIPFNKSKLKREKYILDILDHKIAVPKILDYWHGDEEHTGALLLSFIDGEPITGKISSSLAYDMGILLAELHQVEMIDYQLVDGVTGDWWQSIKIRFYEWIDECASHLDEIFHSSCCKKFEEMFSDLPKADGPALIHFDYRPGNVLVKDDKIIGLIDFESSRGGSRDLDFTKVKVCMWDVFKDTKEAFIKGYESIRELPDIKTTLPLYLFFNGIGGLAWCIRRGKLNHEFYIENYNQVKRLLDV